MTDSRGNKVVVCDNGTGVSCARWELWGGSDLGHTRFSAGHGWKPDQWVYFNGVRNSCLVQFAS